EEERDEPPHAGALGGEHLEHSDERNLAALRDEEEREDPAATDEREDARDAAAAVLRAQEEPGRAEDDAAEEEVGHPAPERQARAGAAEGGRAHDHHEDEG